MELFDVCDEKGIPTGDTVTREEAHAKGIMHRTAHIWIIKKGEKGYEVLMQKRAQNKDSFPGLYDTSSAGHIQAGDEPLESALRELHEELGINATAEQLHFAETFRISYEKEFHGRLFKDEEVAFVYIYMEPVEIESLVLQKEEVEDVAWFNLNSVGYSIFWQTSYALKTYCAPIEGVRIVQRYIRRNFTKGKYRPYGRKISITRGLYEENDSIAVSELAEKYGVSESTIRKDIREISKDNDVTIKDGIVYLNPDTRKGLFSAAEYDVMLKICNSLEDEDPRKKTLLETIERLANYPLSENGGDSYGRDEGWQS